MGSPSTQGTETGPNGHWCAASVDDRAGAVGYGGGMGCFAAMHIRVAA
jgi:hypothetical protein